MPPKAKPKTNIRKEPARKAGQPLKKAGHELFAHALAQGGTADQAYVDAGYARNAGNAARMNAMPHIQARVQELKQAAAKLATVSIARTVEEWRRLAYSNIKDLFDAQGKLCPITELPVEVAASIASIEITQVGEIETLKKVRLWDKRATLEQVARFLGMFEKDNEQARGTVNVNILNP